jgi:hypothetical protein
MRIKATLLRATFALCLPVKHRTGHLALLISFNTFTIPHLSLEIKEGQASTADFQERHISLS